MNKPWNWRSSFRVSWRRTGSEPCLPARGQDSLIASAGVAAIFLVLILAGHRDLMAAVPALASLPDLQSVSKDLQTPPVIVAAPSPGFRVRQTTTGFENSGVHHALYLPANWTCTQRFPVIVEFAGNGNYTNAFGDVSLGTVEGSNLGYGISGGTNYIWICLPFVQSKDGRLTNAITWWGDIAQTLNYCTNTIQQVCRDFGGDTSAIILCGFSRGSIACNFIGLQDDAIAPLWRAFICHSHYDGVNTNWPYLGADRQSALERLRRLKGRPQFITHEGSIAATKSYLEQAGVKGNFTFLEIPFRNHSDQWVLRDVPARQKLKTWLRSLGLP